MAELGPRVDDAEHAHLLLRVGAEGDGATAPEGGGEDLEGGAAAEVWREVATEGGELVGAEEGAVVHLVEGDDGVFGVDDFVVLVVHAGHVRWVSSVEKLPPPHRRNRRCVGSTRHLSHGGHELDQPRRVSHGVVQPQPKYEPSTLQPGHLSIVIHHNFNFNFQ